MKVGIMGGTFDPIHIGHLIAAERVRDTLALDQIWFMPSYVPPHKIHAPEAEPNHRLEMVRRATEDHADFQTIDLEMKLGGTSYTYETMLELRKLHPQTSFSFIIGGDMVEELRNWRNIEKLVTLISFVGLERAGQKVDWSIVPAYIKEKVTMVPMLAIEISSTYIRQQRKSSKSIRYLVLPTVYEYMEANQLYEP